MVEAVADAGEEGAVAKDLWEWVSRWGGKERGGQRIWGDWARGEGRREWLLSVSEGNWGWMRGDGVA